jgi:hypothetical protein
MRAATKARMRGLSAKRPFVAGFHAEAVSEFGHGQPKTAILCDAVRTKGFAIWDFYWHAWC